jgi:hypothetical protein
LHPGCAETASWQEFDWHTQRIADRNTEEEGGYRYFSFFPSHFNHRAFS